MQGITGNKKMARKRWGKPVNDVVKTEEMPSVATKKAEKHKPISPAEWTRSSGSCMKNTIGSAG